MIKYLFIILLGFSSLSFATQDIPLEKQEVAGITFKQDRQEVSPSLVTVVASFFLSVALIVVVVFFIKKFSYKNFDKLGSKIAILETKRLTTKLTLHLVKVDGCCYLIGEKGDALFAMEHKDSEQLNENML